MQRSPQSPSCLQAVNAECGSYLHRLGAFGGIIIVVAFAVIVVVTVTRTYVKNRRGGEPFLVEALTEVICGDDVLGGVEANVLFNGETRGTAGLQPPPVVLGCLTVGPLPSVCVKLSLSVIAPCLAEWLVEAKLNDGAEAVKTNHLRGRVTLVGV